MKRAESKPDLDGGKYTNVLRAEMWHQIRASQLPRDQASFQKCEKVIKIYHVRPVGGSGLVTTNILRFTKAVAECLNDNWQKALSTWKKIQVYVVSMQSWDGRTRWRIVRVGCCLNLASLDPIRPKNTELYQCNISMFKVSWCRRKRSWLKRLWWTSDGRCTHWRFHERHFQREAWWYSSSTTSQGNITRKVNISSDPYQAQPPLLFMSSSPPYLTRIHYLPVHSTVPSVTSTRLGHVMNCHMVI